MSVLRSGNSVGGFVSMELDPSVYSLKAVKKAAFDLSQKASFQIETLPSDRISVVLTAKQQNPGSAESLKTDFTDLVLDHQVRIDVSDEFKLIREMIVAQAFEPCDNLQEVVDTLRDEKKRE